MDFLGESPKLDDAVDALLSLPEIQNVLEQVVGANHRIWYASVRRADAHCDGLPIHQDIQGETGLCVLMSETEVDDGKLVFLPGSHRWPRGTDEGGLGGLLLPKHVNLYLTHATGSPGDIYFFLNKTWHARDPAGDRAATALIITFIPEQAGEWGRRVPAQIRENLGPRLRSLTDPSSGRLALGLAYDASGFSLGEQRALAVRSERTRLRVLSPWWFLRLATLTRRFLGPLKRLLSTQ